MSENEVQEVLEPKGSKKEKEKKTLEQEIISWVVTLATAIVLALVIRTFIF
ncbi:MAG: hypothetical protein IJ461_10200 [Clostridia bacterium]|nr:hypothetical protein [Clostridia bacterium]